MKLCTSLFSAAFLAVFFLTPALNAALLKGTLVQSGDLTIDTSQNLEFLTLNDTKGISYNQALATNYVTQYGFQVATLAQVEQLAADAGVTNITGAFNTADVAGVQTLISYLGSTISVPTTLPNGVVVASGLYGFLNAPGIPAGSANVSGADYQSAALGEATQDQARFAPNFNQFPNTTPAAISGTFLVAVATPEPASVGAMGMGLFLLTGLFLFRRRFSS